MSHALTIAVLLGIVFLSAYCGGGEMFVDAPQAPSRAIPSGGRDPNEVYIPPVQTIRPVIHDAYGIPEHHFGDVPRDPAGESPDVSASEENPDNSLLADAETTPDPSCASGYAKSLADGTCVPVSPNPQSDVSETSAIEDMANVDQMIQNIAGFMGSV